MANYLSNAEGYIRKHSSISDEFDELSPQTAKSYEYNIHERLSWLQSGSFTQQDNTVVIAIKTNLQIQSYHRSNHPRPQTQQTGT